MAQPPAIPLPKVAPSLRDVGFALGIIGIICILFLPIPPFLIDMIDDFQRKTFGTPTAEAKTDRTG